jgi:hypothetical protein
MTRTRAKLQRVTVATPDMDRAMAVPGLMECDELERDLRNDHLAKGEVLRAAMDTRSRIAINVMVVLDWASGTALRFQALS